MGAYLYERLARFKDGRERAVSDGRTVLDYAALFEAAARCAGALRERHGQGRYLVLHAEPSVEFVVTLLGTAFSGNIPVPVDPAIHERNLAQVLARCAAGEVLAPLPLAGLAAHAPLAAPAPGIPALVLFTSGTTGDPKGVVVSDGNLAHSMAAIADYLDYHRFRSAAVVLPLHYSYALLSQVVCQLAIGGYLRIFRDTLNPYAVQRVVEDEALQTFCGVPSTFVALTRMHRLKPLTMSGVRVVCSAGAAFDQERYADLKQVFPAAAVFNNYGMTEAAPRLAWIRDDDPHFLRGSCGRPMAGVTAKVVDPQTGAALPDGTAGMLVVKGPNIMAGYLNDEVRTREAFTGDGFLKTGDVACLQDGYIFLRGRYDDMFNVGGEKVAPAEIERELAALPMVGAAAVAGWPDANRGSVPVAFLMLARPSSRRELIEALAPRLDAVKIPVRYFEVSALPMTGSGKLRRRELLPGCGLILREIV